MMLVNPYMVQPAAGGGGANHRFWRFTGISSGSLLEISEIQLLVGATVVSEGKTYSSFTPPETGFALANLFDGSLSTRCYWFSAGYSDPSFYIKIDLGSAMAVDGVKQAGFDTSDRYMTAFTLEYSDDNSTWTTAATKSGLAYPGNNTLSTVYSVP